MPAAYGTPGVQQFAPLGGGALGGASSPIVSKRLSQDVDITTDKFTTEVIGQQIPIVIGTGPVVGMIVYGAQVTVTTVYQGAIDPGTSIDGVGGDTGDTGAAPPPSTGGSGGGDVVFPDELICTLTIGYTPHIVNGGTGVPGGPAYSPAVATTFYIHQVDLDANLSGTVVDDTGAFWAIDSSDFDVSAFVQTISEPDWTYAKAYNGPGSYGDITSAAWSIASLVISPTLSPVDDLTGSASLYTQAGGWLGPIGVYASPRSGGGGMPAGSIDLSSLSITVTKSGAVSATYTAVSVDSASDHTVRVRCARA